jgi:hypothetical protein
MKVVIVRDQERNKLRNDDIFNRRDEIGGHEGILEGFLEF